MDVFYGTGSESSNSHRSHECDCILVVRGVGSVLISAGWPPWCGSSHIFYSAVRTRGSQIAYDNIHRYLILIRTVLVIFSEKIIPREKTVSNN